MEVKVNKHTDSGILSKNMFLSQVVEREIMLSKEPLSKTQDILCNLIEILAKKRILTLDEISEDVLCLENYDPDNPAIEIKKLRNKKYY